MKTVKYRRWVLVNTFLVFFFLGVLIVGQSNGKAIDAVLSLSAPLALACFGTFLVDNLLSYFESVMGLKTEKSED